MPLADSFNTRSVNSLRLSKMNGVPSSEDLKYALKEAAQKDASQKDARKQYLPYSVELPFTNPLNAGGTAFLIAVSAGQGVLPPRWTFYRMEGDSLVKLWVRETAEVIMIQGRIKVESLYQRSGDTGQNLPVIDGELLGLSDRLSPEACPEADGEGGAEVVLLESQGEELLCPGTAKCAYEPYDLFSRPLSGTIVESVPIDREEVNKLLSLLKEPVCGLLSFHAFCIFLLSWCSPRPYDEAPLSLIVLKVRGSDGLEPAPEYLSGVAKCITRLCAPYDVTAYFGGGAFALLRWGADSATALTVAEALCSVIDESSLFPHHVSLRVSCGIATISARSGAPKEPGMAIAAARAACDMAYKSGMAVLVFAGS